LGLNYTGLIAPIVRAIQALSAEITSIENTIAGFAQSFTTAILYAQEADVQKLCVGSTCVTPAQFQAMLAAANQPGTNAGGPTSASSRGLSSSTQSYDASTIPDTPPIIHRRFKSEVQQCGIDGMAD
jgi:hypothetical protein